MKHIPNIFSISRIILFIALLRLFEHPFAFAVCYTIAGMTDVLDGFIARKFKVESPLGARLDSLGDLFFYLVLTSYLIVVHSAAIAPYWIPIGLLVAIRLGNLAWGLFKFRKATSIHTIANKVSGLLIFALPLMLLLNVRQYLIPTTVVAFWAAIEETIILTRSPKGSINLNRRSLFSK